MPKQETDAGRTDAGNMSRPKRNESLRRFVWRMDVFKQE